jgi:hypothetical protein
MVQHNTGQHEWFQADMTAEACILTGVVACSLGRAATRLLLRYDATAQADSQLTGHQTHWQPLWWRTWSTAARLP